MRAIRRLHDRDDQLCDDLDDLAEDIEELMVLEDDGELWATVDLEEAAYVSDSLYTCH